MKFRQIEYNSLYTYPLETRKSKVSINNFMNLSNKDFIDKFLENYNLLRGATPKKHLKNIVKPVLQQALKELNKK